MLATIARSAIIIPALFILLQALPGCGGGSSSPPPATGKIAFISTRDSNRYEIYIMNDNGTGLTRFTNNTGQESTPCFSPDGSKIVYGYTPDPTEEPDIYIANTDGSGSPLRLTDSIYRDAFPTFSPDGTTIAYEIGVGTICFIPAAGGTEIRGLSGRQPNFDPSGAKIVYSRRNVDTEIMHIFITDFTPPGSSLSQGIALTDTDDSDVHPVFDPSGAKIAFQRGTGPSREVYIMDWDGKNQRQLTYSGGHSYGPLSFNHDGSRIAFVSDRDGNEEIYTMDPDGTNQTRVTRNPAADTAPSYVPMLVNLNGLFADKTSSFSASPLVSRL